MCMYMHIYVCMYLYICIYMYEDAPSLGRRKLARESVGTSFICLKDVVKDVVILGVLSERRRIVKNK